MMIADLFWKLIGILRVHIHFFVDHTIERAIICIECVLVFGYIITYHLFSHLRVRWKWKGLYIGILIRLSREYWCYGLLLMEVSNRWYLFERKRWWCWRHLFIRRGRWFWMTLSNLYIIFYIRLRIFIFIELSLLLRLLWRCLHWIRIAKCNIIFRIIFSCWGHLDSARGIGMISSWMWIRWLYYFSLL